MNNTPVYLTLDLTTLLVTEVKVDTFAGRNYEVTLSLFGNDDPYSDVIDRLETHLVLTIPHVFNGENYQSVVSKVGLLHVYHEDLHYELSKERTKLKNFAMKIERRLCIYEKHRQLKAVKAAERRAKR